MPAIEFNLPTLILVVFSVINIPLSVFILRQNPKSWTNRLFFLLIIFLTVYLVVNTQLYLFKDYDTRLFLGRFIMANGAILNLLVFLFLYIFPDFEFRLRRLVFIPLLTVTALLFFAAFTDLIFKGITISEGNIVTPEPGVLLPVFGLHTILLVLGGLVSIYLRRRKAGGLKKIRINYVFFATGVLFFLILTFNFFFPVVLKYGNFVPFLPLYILIFLVTVTYAIVKHQLFGLSVLATQVFTVVLWIILLSNLFSTQDNTQRLVNGFVLLASIILGTLLMRSVIREVEQRQKLEELTTKLKILDKQKDEFLSVASHELRTPLTAIKGYISMLLHGDAGKMSKEAEEFLKDASLASERMIRLIQNLLDVGRIEEGRIVYRMENVSLKEVMERIYREFLPEAEINKLELRLDIPGDIKDKVYVDSDRIYEVLGNLVGNAVKYTDEGRVILRMGNPNSGTVRVEVEDTGLGISPESRKKLFQKFYRSEEHAGQVEGTGLGLYVSRLLIEKFQGKIGVNSKVGKGSTFFFELPLVRQG